MTHSPEVFLFATLPLLDFLMLFFPMIDGNERVDGGDLTGTGARRGASTFFSVSTTSVAKGGVAEGVVTVATFMLLSLMTPALSVGLRSPFPPPSSPPRVESASVAARHDPAKRVSYHQQ